MTELILTEVNSLELRKLKNYECRTLAVNYLEKYYRMKFRKKYYEERT